MSYLESFRVQQALNRVYKRTPTLVGGTAVGFYKDRFRFQAWQDETREVWPERRGKDKKKKRRRLLTKTGRLKRSIRVVSKGSNHVVVGTDVPYAQAHNEGFKGKVSQHVSGHTVKEHKRRSHTRDGRRVKAQVVQSHRKKSFTRTLDQNIEKRQFMGKSTFLNRRMERVLEFEINKELRFLKSI
jgi:phage gpG-like protein